MAKEGRESNQIVTLIIGSIDSVLDPESIIVVILRSCNTHIYGIVKNSRFVKFVLLYMGWDG